MDKEAEELEKKLDKIYKVALNNQKATKKNAKDIKENFERIQDNSCALSILKDYKHEAIIWKIAFFITLALLVIVSIHHFIFK